MLWTYKDLEESINKAFAPSDIIKYSDMDIGLPSAAIAPHQCWKMP